MIDLFSAERLRAVAERLRSDRRVPVVLIFGAVVATTTILVGSFMVQPEIPELTADVELEATAIVASQGYAVRYPSRWQTTEPAVEGDSVRHALVLSNGQLRVVILTTETIRTDTLIPTPVLTETIGTVTARRYRDYDPETGGPLDRVVIERAEGGFLELRGYGPIFDRIVKSLTLVPSEGIPSDNE